MTNLTAPHFTNEDKAREYLEALRWPQDPFCPHCGYAHRAASRSARARRHVELGEPTPTAESGDQS